MLARVLRLTGQSPCLQRQGSQHRKTPKLPKSFLGNLKSRMHRLVKAAVMRLDYYASSPELSKKPFELSGAVKKSLAGEHASRSG